MVAPAVTYTPTVSGHPTTGVWGTGAVVIDSANSEWVCTAGGSPGTWASVTGSGGAVSSVFTRTGAVTAQTGDYTAAQVGAVSVTGGGVETISALGTVTTTATCNLANGNVFTCTQGGNTTFTFSGATNSAACTFELRATQDGTGGRTSTWPGSVSWVGGGSAPAPNTAAGALNVWTFQSLDGGTTWLGSLLAPVPTLPLTVANGGTGDTSLTAYAVLTGGTTTTSPVQSVAALGSAGNPLVSGGAGALPSFTAPLAPVTFALTDAATITVNAASGNVQTVTLGGNRTMGAPSNPVTEMPLIFELKQDGTGSRTVTWTSGAGGYTFGAAGAPTLTTTAGATDFVGFRYSAIVGKYCYMGSQLGFS